VIQVDTRHASGVARAIVSNEACSHTADASEPVSHVRHRLGLVEEGRVAAVVAAPSAPHLLAVERALLEFVPGSSGRASTSSSTGFMIAPGCDDLGVRGSSSASFRHWGQAREGADWVVSGSVSAQVRQSVFHDG
jgi:hypothetical protein